MDANPNLKATINEAIESLSGDDPKGKIREIIRNCGEMAPIATEIAVALVELAMEAKEAKAEAVLQRKEKYQAQRAVTRAKEDMTQAVTRAKEDMAEAVTRAVTRAKEDLAKVMIRAAEDQGDAIKARVGTNNELDVATAVEAVASAAAMAAMEPERQVGTGTPVAKREE